MLQSAISKRKTTAKPKNTLHLAAMWSTAIICKKLIDEGAEVDAKNDDLSTSLHLAAFVLNDPEAENKCPVFIEAGANVKAKDSSGRTPPRQLLSDLVVSGNC